jgi:diguanylate cyclase (GGDEF)-like protein
VRADSDQDLRAKERNSLADQLAAARHRIAELEARLSQVEHRDPLTGSLLSQRAFRTQLELDVARADRYARPLSIALIDVDRFRQLNLEHGYPAGDAVLAGLGHVIAEETRMNDLACRMGGDEFAILFGETEAVEAQAAVQRILLKLEELEVGALHGIPVSVGIAGLRPGQRPEALLADAGAALEEARAAGGSQAVLHADGQAKEKAGAGQGNVIAALASALEERDRYTGEHSESVVDLTARVGDALAIGPREIEEIRTAALLHDIGKVGVPDEILHKPGKLDEHEWEIMRQHPVIGERILRAIPGFGSIARMVRHEHERWDGSGYPDRLAGTAIPIGSRIILACDAYHAMTSNRPYRKAMPHADAMAELTANSGTQFDPDVVQALVGYLYGRRQAGLAAV